MWQRRAVRRSRVSCLKALLTALFRIVLRSAIRILEGAYDEAASSGCSLVDLPVDEHNGFFGITHGDWASATWVGANDSALEF